MDGNKILLPPWQPLDQGLDVDKQPHDLQEKSWRHLNLFQHNCYIHA